MARPVMTLVAERHLVDLIKPPPGSRVLEASGVVAKDGSYYVVFDNIRRIARIDPGLELGSKGHSWFGPRRQGDGYEDIAFSPHTRRFYLLIEAEKHPDGTYKGLIDECDEDGKYTKRRWIDFAFARRNTGFEGLIAVRWKDRNYLLALCEGNGGDAGRKGRTPGRGRIQVLQQAGEVWKAVATIALPEARSVHPRVSSAGWLELAKALLDRAACRCMRLFQSALRRRSPRRMTNRSHGMHSTAIAGDSYLR